ncbi:MAG TPA: hypothetical protein VL068_14615 [Microthrixaceae bacterium]|nr:hypothetical protein [Microthrixaceae bacterium]
MPYIQALNSSFPGATSFANYLARVDRVTAPLGFDRANSFAAVSLCRDELAQSFLGEVERRWEQPFNLGGLGALPSLGRTGWDACLSHVPRESSRGHLIVFGMPHIGFDPDGTLGQTMRRHQNSATSTCGAMVGLLRSLTEGVTAPPEGLDDREAERLNEVMRAQVDELPLDLLELTKVAAHAVDKEIWAEIEALGAHKSMDVAVFCGVQIHLPDDVDHIWPIASSIQGADGERISIEL